MQQQFKNFLRASPSICAKNFPFCTSKPYFFYFTHPFLQNIHISLSILHIYSIKYSFFYIFYYFLTRGLSLSLSLSLTTSHSLSDPTTVIITQPPSSRNPYLYTCFVLFLFLILMVDRSRNPDETETQTHSTQNPRLIGAKVDQIHSSAAAAKVNQTRNPNA